MMGSVIRIDEMQNEAVFGNDQKVERIAGEILTRIFRVVTGWTWEE